MLNKNKTFVILEFCLKLCVIKFFEMPFKFSNQTAKTTVVKPKTKSTTGKGVKYHNVAVKGVGAAVKPKR